MARYCHQQVSTSPVVKAISRAPQLTFGVTIRTASQQTIAIHCTSAMAGESRCFIRVCISPFIDNSRHPVSREEHLPQKYRLTNAAKESTEFFIITRLDHT
ncbi:hypothetical protein KPSA3_05063 [Pseudomonas syringae pv. actinidiae]|uniref:Uncharacterized protein n=1 Tax=Pseudomonas syringae pv. actinidiae TaxID=103796 RepID=A0AAN4Q811_PSESF|nr:hypothetical protein KPSA3_05063 [Pseudomonas syringae pv. actinidiae]